jgi:hypothetical protein
VHLPSVATADERGLGKSCREAEASQGAMRANSNSIGTTNGQPAALISRVFTIRWHVSWDVRMDDSRREARKPLCTHAGDSRTDTDSANNTALPSPDGEFG